MRDAVACVWRSSNGGRGYAAGGNRADRRSACRASPHSPLVVVTTYPNKRAGMGQTEGAQAGRALPRLPTAAALLAFQVSRPRIAAATRGLRPGGFADVASLSREFSASILRRTRPAAAIFPPPLHFARSSSRSVLSSIRMTAGALSRPVRIRVRQPSAGTALAESYFPQLIADHSTRAREL
jgi:hypothetical protein